MTRFYLLLFILIFSFSCKTLSASHDKQSETEEQALANDIKQILKKTNTKGVAIATIDEHGQVWRYTSGLADIKNNVPISEQTQFRLGSISKILVSLSIMKLVDENRLSLDDNLAKIVPEIEFNNPWEQQSPIKIHHLLTHTTGWNAPSFKVHAHNDVEPIGIHDALALDPKSRTSRWVPGSRAAYNNTGPVVAAYIVEKVTGIRFEDYVKQSFFIPLEMNSSDFFYTEHYRNNAAKLYRGEHEQAYQHLAYRASGALNSNLNDMIKFSEFLLSHSHTNNIQLSKQAITQMESVFGSLASQAGLNLGFGLGLSMFHHNGFIYFGHEGSVKGGTSLIAYSRDLNVAHIILSNSETPATSLIHKRIAQYQSKHQTKSKQQNHRDFNQNELKLTGFYRMVSPVNSISTAFHALIPWQLSVTAKSAWIKPLFGGTKRPLLSANNNTFKQHTTGRIALVTVQDPILGQVLHYGPQTLQKVSGVQAYLPLLLVLLWVLSALISLLFALIWIPRRILKRIEPGPSISVRVWPLVNVTNLILLLIASLAVKNAPSPFVLASTFNLVTGLIFLLTITFAASSFYSAYIVFRYRKVLMNRFVFYFSAFCASISVLLTLFLLSYGLIGIRIWSL